MNGLGGDIQPCYCWMWARIMIDCVGEVDDITREMIDRFRVILMSLKERNYSKEDRNYCDHYDWDY